MTNVVTFADQNRGHPVTRRALHQLRAKLSQRRQERAVRKDLREMLKLDDHILRDIGYSRYDIKRAISRPYSISAYDELVRVRAKSAA